jgi:hypothetical protein
MTPKAFAKKIGLYRQTGKQDAGNVMDPNELCEALGTKTPSKAAIKAWLLKDGKPEDLRIEDMLDPGETVSKSQKLELFKAWADGWSTYASEWLKSAAEEMS